MRVEEWRSERVGDWSDADSHGLNGSADLVLAFGSRERTRFHSGQATELLQFLARVLEKLIRVWLDLPEDDEG